MMDALTRAWDGTPREQAVAWLLQKASRQARCAIWSHPFGWELRVNVAGEFVRSQAYRAADDVVRDIEAWRAQFVAKGWQAMS